MEPNFSWQIKQILFPCDFSPQTEKVMLYACDLAKRYEAALTLFHDYEAPTYAIPPDATILASPEVLAQQIADIMSALDALKQKAEAVGVKVVHTKVAQGIPATEIVREALEGHYQLIVMGTHGRTGLKHVLIGSVAEKVVRKASCPVLTIRTLIT